LTQTYSSKISRIPRETNTIHKKCPPQRRLLTLKCLWRLIHHEICDMPIHSLFGQMESAICAQLLHIKRQN